MNGCIHTYINLGIPTMYELVPHVRTSSCRPRWKKKAAKLIFLPPTPPDAPHPAPAPLAPPSGFPTTAPAMIFEKYILVPPHWPSVRRPSVALPRSFFPGRAGPRRGSCRRFKPMGRRPRPDTPLCPRFLALVGHGMVRGPTALAALPPCWTCLAGRAEMAG